MHRFRIDPATGWDYDPKFARLRRRLAWIGFLIWMLCSGRVISAFPVVGIVIACCLVLFVCALALSRGLQARTLARRAEDTRLARQLRWEQSVGLAIGGLLFGTLLSFQAWAASSAGPRLLAGLGAVLVLGTSLSGLWLSWRYRPDSIGFAEHPPAPERR